MAIRAPRYDQNKTRVTSMPVPAAVYTGVLPEVHSVLVDEIHIDDSYQRELNDHKARAIADAFEEMAAGLILLSRRADGSLWCYDGQTRLAAVRMLERPLIAAAIYDGLSIPDEARLFVRCNYERGLPKTFAVFRARLRALDPIALDIMRVLDELGIRIASAQTRTRRHPGEVWALGLCERIYKLGGREGLKFALRAAVELWPSDNHNMAQYVIAGLFRFGWEMADKGVEHDWPRRLAGTNLDDLIEDANQFARVKHTSVSVGFARAILERYNHRREKKLPDTFKKALDVTSEHKAISG